MIAENPHRPYTVINTDNKGFIVAMQERTTEQECKCVVIPADDAESRATAVKELRTYNRQCEMLSNDIRRIRRTAPQTHEYTTAVQMYQDHMTRAGERQRGIETTATIVKGINALLMSCAETRQVGRVFVAVLKDDAGNVIGTTDTTKLTELFASYLAPAETTINQDDVEALKVNGMEAEIHAMYYRLYDAEQRQERRYAEEAHRASTPFLETLQCYCNSFFDYLQRKIDIHKAGTPTDLAPIIIKDADNVLNLLRETITTYYKAPAKDKAGRTTENGKGSKIIGCVIGVLLSHAYIDTCTPPNELHKRFMQTFPQCAQIEWRGVARYFDSEINSNAHREFVAYVKRYIEL